MNLSLKDSVNKIKSHARDPEKTSAITTPGKRLNSEYVNTYSSNVRRQPNLKVEDLIRYLKEYIQIDNKQEKILNWTQ